MVRRRNPWLRAGLYLTLLVFAFLYIYPFLLELGTSFKTETDAVSHPVNPVPHDWVVTAFTAARPAGLPDLVHELGRGRGVRYRRPGAIRLDGRIRARAPPVPRPQGVCSLPSSPSWRCRASSCSSRSSSSSRTLGIYDTYPGLVIPLLADAAGVFIMKQFFESIPASIEEAAHIDGAGTFRTFWSVVLPMARPALMALTILSFQGSWNDFSGILIAHESPSLDTLTTGVGRLVSGQLGSGTEYPLKLAAAMAMTIPVAVIFFVFQKHIMRTDQGAVKE